MSPLSWRDRLPQVNSALLGALFVLIPTQIAPVYVLSMLMLGLWIVDGHLRDKWQALQGNPVFWVFQAFFWWVVIALAWTDDMAAGRGMVTRHLFFVLAAVYLTVARREHAHRYLLAFAISVVLCESLAAYNWLQINHHPQWPAGLRAQKDSIETAPFVDRIMFGPIVAFAGYVGACRALASRGARRAAWTATVASAFVALSFSGSRAGLVIYTLMMALFAFQALARRRITALAVASAVLVGIPIGLYALADPATTQRMGLIFSESHQLDSAVNASIPHRYTMAVNTLHLIAEHPWLGVGSGDFVAEYKAVNDLRSPAWIAPRNPHNQLLFTVATTGVFGGLLLLAVWFAPPWLARRWPDDGLRPLRIGLPVFYFVVCLSESYIWRTNTGLMFVLFSALLYGPGPQGQVPAAPSTPASRR